MTVSGPILPLVKVAMPARASLMAALESVLYSGMIAEGEAVYEFERNFGKLFNLPNALAVNSGTAALHIAFIMAGVKPGDEVITTSMTAEPTNTTLLQVGAVPVFADVDPETGNLDPDSVLALINERTRAICVVHYAGYPADTQRLRVIADSRGIALIEDCAHALGAKAFGKTVGVIGDSGIFSFQAIKHMTTVDGGVLTLKSAEMMPEARRTRWFGLTKGVPRTEVDIKSAGFKYNMNNVSATIGNQQLLGITALVDKHIENGRFFDKALCNIPGVKSAKVISGTDPSYWLYTLLCDDSDDVERRLADVGVSASKLHRPNHLHSIFAPYRSDLPGLERFYKRLVHIPCGWWVHDYDREKIANALRRG